MEPGPGAGQEVGRVVTCAARDCAAGTRVRGPGLGRGRKGARKGGEVGGGEGGEGRGALGGEERVGEEGIR